MMPTKAVFTGKSDFRWRSDTPTATVIIFIIILSIYTTYLTPTLKLFLRKEWHYNFLHAGN